MEDLDLNKLLNIREDSYVDISLANNAEMILDGYFSISELERIIKYMKKDNKKEEVKNGIRTTESSASVV